jgi:DNA-binding SARP family transcriptional activator
MSMTFDSTATPKPPCHLPSPRRTHRQARIDPLRESPQATLIRVQLSMGNQAGATEVLDRYRIILHAAVGLDPTKQLTDLVRVVER